MQKKIKKQRISELVDCNNVYACALYYLGIKFYEHSEETLEQVCFEKGLNLKQVVKELESPEERFQSPNLPLISYPIDLIIEYLRHAHLMFVKYKLPYIAGLIESFNEDCDSYKTVEKDLKTLFPLFLEDFIRHIHEEEDTLFEYILTLEKVSKGTVTNLSRLYYMMEQNSMQCYAVEHEAHDDEMDGIRQITNNYVLQEEMPLHMKVIYSELVRFEASLKTHARIENEILFPKAILLEKQVKQSVEERLKYN